MHTLLRRSVWSAFVVEVVDDFPFALHQQSPVSTPSIITKVNGLVTSGCVGMSVLAGILEEMGQFRGLRR
jgi:hypothetical protein